MARSSPGEKLPFDREPRSCERYIAWSVSPRIRARIREKAAERRQKCGADAIGSRHSTNLSPPPGAFILLLCSPWGSRPRLRTCHASGASLHLIRPVWRRSNLRYLPIAGRDRWVELATRRAGGTGQWVGGRVALRGRCQVLPQDPRVPSGDFEQRQSRPLRVSPTLLPVAQRMNADPKGV